MRTQYSCSISRPDCLFTSDTELWLGMGKALARVDSKAPNSNRGGQIRLGGLSTLFMERVREQEDWPTPTVIFLSYMYVYIPCTFLPHPPGPNNKRDPEICLSFGEIKDKHALIVIIHIYIYVRVRVCDCELYCLYAQTNMYVDGPSITHIVKHGND